MVGKDHCFVSVLAAYEFASAEIKNESIDFATQTLIKH
jgi:hypothetical protein